MSRPTPPTYNTTNWPSYNEALKRRGSLTIWFDPEMSWETAPTGRRGRQQTYSDAAIQTCLCHRRPERLHRARHTRHRGRGISLFAERRSPAIGRFVQQSHPLAVTPADFEIAKI